MKVWPESVRWRLTLWYAAVLAVPLIMFAAGSRYLVKSTMSARADWFLQAARSSFMSELETELASASPSRAVRAATRDVRFRDIAFVVLDARDSLLGESVTDDSTERAPKGVAQPEVDRDRLLAYPGRHAHVPTLGWLPGPDSVHRVIASRVSLRGRSYTIAAVQSRSGINTTVGNLTLGYFIAIPVFLLVASAGGYLLARSALAPVAMMSRQARAIGASNLHERLPVPVPHDELHELSTMVNELLQRLELSFEQQRRFVANASHELRTPVAIVRAESEIALGRDGRQESEYRDSLVVVRDAADRMSRIVRDLFLLARADAGNTPMQTEPLYLDEMVSDVSRSMRGVASQSGVKIDVAPMSETPFVGDVELLGRMLLNLIDNAVKFSPPESTVHVKLARNNGTHLLTVSDEGAGIPTDAQPHVFERFFRADKSRAPVNGSATSGAGLGLAIVQLVAEAHGGKAELEESSPAGSTFVVALPAVN
ncbi:MAG TPA: ATP-binding protein [Gemmatimonadaceae bacterium]|nr:ATP-binding protein [Gemmatimonadaceae bacterium]